MPTLPEINEMRDLIIKSGISEKELQDEVDKLLSRKPIYRKNRKLLYKALCDKYNVNLKITYRAPNQNRGEYTTVSQLTKDQKIVNMRGYILHIPDPYETSTGSGMRTTFTFADETGVTGIGIFQRHDGDHIDNFINDFRVTPAPVYLISVSTGEWNDKISIGLPPFADWEKIGSGDYDLPELETVLNKLADSRIEPEENEHYVFRGLLIDHEEGISYTGCPICRKKMEVDEGTTAVCGNCSKTVTAQKYVGSIIMLGDEHGEIAISFSEWTGVTVEKLTAMRANDSQPEVIVGSTYSEQYQFSGQWIKFVDGNEVTIDKGTGKIGVPSGSIDQLDFSNEDNRKEAEKTDDDPGGMARIEEFVQLYLTRIKHYGSLTPDEFADFLRKHLGTDFEYKVKPVIAELLKRKAITIQGNVFKVA